MRIVRRIAVAPLKAAAIGLGVVVIVVAVLALFCVDRICKAVDSRFPSLFYDRPRGRS